MRPMMWGATTVTIESNRASSLREIEAGPRATTK
jgi:hypothetical protein